MASQDCSMLTQERLDAFGEVSTAELARRLEEDDYPSPFDLSLIHI